MLNILSGGPREQQPRYVWRFCSCRCRSTQNSVCLHLFSVAHWPPLHSRIADSNLTCFGRSPSFSQVSGCVCLPPVVTFATSFVTVRKYGGPSKWEKTSRCGRRLSVLQVSLVVHHTHDLHISTVGCGSCGKETCVSCANTEVIVTTITIFVSLGAIRFCLCAVLSEGHLVVCSFFANVLLCWPVRFVALRVLHQRVTERNLLVSSAGHVVETTHICGRLLSCVYTFATTMWVFTKRWTICFGEFCSPDEVGRVGRGHVVVGVVRRCQQWQTLGGSFLVVFFRRSGDTDLRRGPSKEHETETVDQHNTNASSLFVAFARSFGTAEIIHDRGHAPYNNT